MKELFQLLKEGNKSALTAAIVNVLVSVIKGVTYIFTGNVAMFAETLHSLGDAANQFFVFVGSALSKKTPDKALSEWFWTCCESCASRCCSGRRYHGF